MAYGNVSKTLGSKSCFLKVACSSKVFHNKTIWTFEEACFKWLIFHNYVVQTFDGRSSMFDSFIDKI